jgi:hypothetical protein
MTNVETRRAGTTFLSQWGTSLILVTGIFVVPLSLALLANSYSAPDAAAYVRMAFANVAGQTVAIVTVAGLLVWQIVSRARLTEIIRFAAIGAAVTFYAVSIIAAGGDMLLQRLDLLG